MDADSDTITSVLSARTALAALMSIPLAALLSAFSLTVLVLVLRTVARGNVGAVALMMVLGAGYAAPNGARTCCRCGHATPIR